MRTFLKRRAADFNVFFCFATNTVFFKQKLVWSKHTLPSNCFYAYLPLSQPNTFLMKFVNHPKHFWALFWSAVSFNNSLNSAFFVELELVGLGFRIRKISSTVYRFFWGYATFAYLFVPADLLVEYLPEERTIFFFGIDVSTVNNFSSYLALLKRASTYRVTGFIRPGKIIRLNSGKQR